jgi:inner membrane protein
MDNLTPSLTGVLAARVLPPDPADGPAETPKGKPKTGRLLFWLTLASVNLPDVDVVANFFTDPLNALHYHRGFTHSFLLAPAIALLPALVARIVNRKVRFAWCWMAATIGILLHISVDLITPYGTQIFFPVSEARYSLDWMFIVDPWFTGALTLFLVAGKLVARFRREAAFTALAFAGIYIGAESRLHSRALDLFTDQLARSGTRAFAAAVLPQPLGLTGWVGLAMTKEGPVRQYLHLFREGGVVAPEFFPNPSDRYTMMAMQTSYVSKYLRFARFPAIEASEREGRHMVEFRDLQFSVDPGIVRAVGLGERDIPFVLRLEYGRSDNLVSVTFNGRPVPLE